MIRHLVAALVAAALVAGCSGGDGDGDGDDEPSTSTVVEASVDAGSRTAPAPTTDPGSVEVPAVGAETVEVRLADPSSTPAGLVTWTIEVANVSDQAVTLTFPTSQSADVTLLDRNNPVHRWSDDRFFEQRITTVTIEPGAVEQLLLPDDLTDVPPGTYDVEVVVHAVGGLEAVADRVQVTRPAS